MRYPTPLNQRKKIYQAKNFMNKEKCRYTFSKNESSSQAMLQSWKVEYEYVERKEANFLEKVFFCMHHWLRTIFVIDLSCYTFFNVTRNDDSDPSAAATLQTSGTTPLPQKHNGTSCSITEPRCWPGVQTVTQDPWMLLRIVWTLGNVVDFLQCMGG